MKTREDLIRRALVELKVLAAGQAPSAEDAQEVGREIGPLLSNLAKRGVYPFGSEDQIEDDAFVPLAKLLANSVAGSFGSQPDENVRLLEERNLRALMAETISYQPLQAEYF